MKTPVTLLLLSLPFLSCSGNSGPVGSYQLDSEAMAADMQAKMEEGMAGQSGEQADMAKAMIKPMLDMMSKMKVSIDVKEDGTFAIHSDNPDGSHSHVNGTWTQNGDQITMVGKEEGKDQEETKVLTMKGGDLVLVEEQNGMKMEMRFRRK